MGMDDLFAIQATTGVTLSRTDVERLIGLAPQTLVD